MEVVICVHTNQQEEIQMITTILFVLTATLSVFNLLRIISIIVGNSMTLPNIYRLRTDMWYIVYPCAAYQVYFWASYSNIIGK